jgi:hypothetical protein
MVKKKDIEDLLGASDVEDMDRLVFEEGKEKRNSGKNPVSVSRKQ